MARFLTLHDPRAARRYYDAGLWRADTLYALLARNADARPNAEALRDGGRRLDWAALKAWVDSLAAGLAARGLAPGARVSLWLPNRADAVAAFLACSRQGLACNPSLHRSTTHAEIAGLLRRLDTALLVSEAAVDGVPAVAPEALAGDAARLGAPADDPDQVSYLAFTSGTTGEPKCVMHSDNTLLANARDLVRDWGHGPDMRLLTLSPLTHHIAWVAVAQWLVAGGTLIVDDAPAPMDRLDWLLETRPTYVMGVPTHAIDMLAAQNRRGLARLGEVRVFYMAGAPIPAAVAEAFVAQGVKPQNVYGMTENSSHQYTHADDDTETIVATCGRGGPAYEVRIFAPDDPDRALPAGEVGQIGGRGAALMLGYFADQRATEASFNRDGWFMSGDLGVLDSRGNLSIVGRLKDLIIRGGRNIQPARIEDLALRHAGVDKAAVFPVADARLGEKACIAVLGSVAAESLLAHLAAQGLPRYDMPEYFLRLESFPLTPSGKVLKRALVEAVRRGELAPEPVRFAARKEDA